MVKHCTLCKAAVIRGKGVTGRSFHRFPAPQYLREKWCQILNKDINNLSSSTVVCSDHFTPECFVYRSNGQRFLKDDVVPQSFKGKICFRERKKQKYKKLQLNLDNVTIKTECEERELQKEDLDIQIKLENDDPCQETEGVSIKTERIESDEVFIKIENNSVQWEPSEDFGIKSEDKFESDNEEKDLNGNTHNTSKFDNTVEAQSEDTCRIPPVDNEDETVNKKMRQSTIDPELIKEFAYFSTTNEDVLLQLFKVIYPKPLTGEAYSCIECSFRTIQRTIFRRHFLGHRDMEYKKHPELYVNYKTYLCAQCGYVSILKRTLTRHMVKHRPTEAVKMFVCNECEYTTKYSCGIVKHQIKHIPPDFKLFCTKCSYKAFEQSRFDEHMKKGHIENMKYKYECEKCPFKTDSKYALRRHIRVSHSNNKPFKYECRYCSFKNDSKGSLNRHMKYDHTELIGSDPDSN